MKTMTTTWMTAALAPLEPWRFVRGVTPMSRVAWPLLTVVAYFSTLRVLARVMRERKPMVMPRFLYWHNLVLSGASLALFAALTSIIVEQWRYNLTFQQLICSKDIFDDGRIQAVYYVNHLFKYWELVDTVLQVLRKKPVPFLHQYHHAATLVLTWSQIVEYSGCQWVPIGFNLFVHIFMYWYYAQSAIKRRVWWKRHLTTLQCIQFVVGVSVASYAYAVFIVGGWKESACYGTPVGAVTGISVLLSYLVLFVRFYIQTYKAPRAAKLPAKTQ